MAIPRFGDNSSGGAAGDRYHAMADKYKKDNEQKGPGLISRNGPGPRGGGVPRMPQGIYRGEDKPDMHRVPKEEIDPRLLEAMRQSALPSTVRFAQPMSGQPAPGWTGVNGGNTGMGWNKVGAGVGLYDPTNPQPGVDFGKSLATVGNWLSEGWNSPKNEGYKRTLGGDNKGLQPGVGGLGGITPEQLNGNPGIGQQITNAYNAASQPTPWAGNNQQGGIAGLVMNANNAIGNWGQGVKQGYNQQNIANAAEGNMSGARYGAAYDQYQNDPNQFYNPTLGSFGRGDWNYADAMRYNTRSSLAKGGIGHVDPSLTKYYEGYGSPSYGLKTVNGGGGGGGGGYGWGWGGGGGGYSGSSYSSPAWVTGLMNWRI